MNISRREFLNRAALAGAAIAAAPRAGSFAAEPGPVLQLKARFAAPIRIESIELLKAGDLYFVRSRSSDGVTGVALASERMNYLYPMLLQRVLPYFVGKDAREIETLVDGVYTHASNYKLAGVPFWCCVAAVEFSLFDLLGKTAGVAVGELLGGVRRREIPVYLSSMRRDTTPEQEVEWLGKRLAETNSKAIKLKIGGRMSRNADAAPGRTERLVALARRTFGDNLTIHVDANGSYDAPKGIEVGKMLEAHQVYFFEEPCPFEDFESTKRVADALEMLVAGGEQDTSYDKFRWMIRNRAVDVVQPDLHYNGGFIRALRVARLAAETRMDITPHAPQPGFHAAYLLQFTSAVPNLGRFQEFPAEYRKADPWFAPAIEVRNSLIKVPSGPGLGMKIDPEFLNKAQRVTQA